jgi:ABC-2 type transport system permease protein
MPGSKRPARSNEEPMNWKKILAVVRREYIERVRTKAFWIGTMIFPGLFIALIGFQIVLSRKAGGDRHLVVVDATGSLYGPLKAALQAIEQERKAEHPNQQSPHWVLTQRPVESSLEATKEALRKEVVSKKLNAYVVLTPGLVEKNQIEYYSTAVSEWTAMNQVEEAFNKIRLRQKITSRGLPADLANDLEKPVKLKAFKVSESGTAEEKGAGILAAIVFFFLMYSTFIMYGAQVMMGVLDEKTNRIVEIIIASVRPTELMLGKMFGIGLVGLTQYAAWALVAMNLSLPGIATMLSSTNMGAPKIPFSMLGFLLLYFILGYFLYASIYTAIAAPFNTNQEAQQLAMIPVMLILSSIAVYPAVLNNPSGGIATFFSIFPFTASLTMFLRTALSDVPVWQIGLSIVSIAATTVAIAWVAGRIYRVGILMYGKKPTIPEIIRWARYSPGKTPAPEIAKA